jgi:PAS domain S-box-containing protein
MTVRTLSSTPPFGLEAATPSFDRAVRLARALFGGAHAYIALVENGRTWRSNDPSGTWPPRAPVVDQVLETGESVWLEDFAWHPQFGAQARDNSIRFFAAAPIRLAGGSTPGALAVFGPEPRHFDAVLARRLADLAAGIADECDRARTREAAAAAAAELAKTRAIIDALVESAPFAWAMTDRDLRLLRVSPKWREVAEDEARLGLTVDAAAPKLFRPLVDQLEACLAGAPTPLERLKIEQRESLRWIEVELTPWNDQAGEPGGVIITLHDVTDLVIALEQAKWSETRLQLALELADIHVTDVDLEKGTVETAGSTETVYDRPERFAWAESDREQLIDPRDRKRARDSWAQYMSDGPSHRVEFRVNRLDGREVWAKSGAKLYRDESGKVTRRIAVAQNITDLKLAEQALVRAKEEAEAANLAKSAFLATMSHEIRTPLNGVLGMAQALALEPLSPSQQERLEVILGSGRGLLAILNDVLDISKIEAGKLELETIAFDLEELVGSVRNIFAPAAEVKGCAFDVRLAAQAKGTYLGDPTRVRQILFNLVSNAVKFTEAGGVAVSVRAVPDGVRIDIEDSGVGIAPERLATLFRKFEQGDASTTRRFGGTGLGLAICHELATLMGGTIGVKSGAPGTVFTVILPLQRPVAVTAQTAGHPAPEALSPEPMIRVLAAEDNATNQLVLKALLETAGVSPRFVETGLGAVEAWEAEPWDVILMDVHMPVMDGPTATRLIRSREADEGRPRTPIVALTANVMSHQIAAYREVGMDDFLAKPIEIDSLFAALDRALQVRALSVAPRALSADLEEPARAL